MGYLRELYGNSMDSYVILMGFLCGSYAMSMIFLWDFCGSPMGFL